MAESYSENPLKILIRVEASRWQHFVLGCGIVCERPMKHPTLDIPPLGHILHSGPEGIQVVFWVVCPVVCGDLQGPPFDEVRGCQQNY